MRVVPLLVLLAALAFAPLRAAEDFRAPFIINYDARVDGGELALHKTAILSPRASISNPEAVRAAGTRILGYISLGELAAQEAEHPVASRVPILGKNALWNSAIPDVTHPAWAEWVLEVCAPKIVERGWQGFFLDTLDSARLPEGLPEETYKAREKAIADILVKLRAKYPTLRIIANRGFASLAKAPQAFDGVLAEGVLSTFAAENKYRTIEEEESRDLRAELDSWKSAGKEVFVLDYCDPENPGEASRLFEKLSGFGYAASVAKPDLMQGAALAPVRRIPNRALVIFGSDIGTGLVEHPANSLTRTTLFHPLQWHGYNIEYVNAREEGFPADLDRYDLVVLEPFQPKPGFDIEEAAHRLAKRLLSSRKTIFLGGFAPWSENGRAWESLTEATGWIGSAAPVPPASKPELVDADRKLLESEDEAAPRTRKALPDLRAPEYARVLIRQATHDPKLGVREFDSAFVAPFGGVLLTPWISEQDPIGRVKARVDFFTFVSRALGAPPPAFDTTTRDGCRLFFAHIDGDGLHAQSKVTLGKRSAEVMRDEIYARYGMPFSSSVITGEIRGMTAPRVDKAEIALRHDIARSIYAMSNVEVACHSHSHPFAWTSDNVTASTYDKARLTLLPEFAHPVDYREETLGSIEYINKNLAPAGKPCRLMLWTGNCLPPPEAIAHLDAAGIAHMNGLATSATFENPYLSVIQGGNLIYRGVTQVGAPFENDNVYYDMERDGLEGGFARVIEAFEITGKPRRLLPVNAYWHFYSADTVERLRALKRVLDWAAFRPLHPVFASEYAAMMRDLPLGASYEDTRGGHLFAMPPGCLTLRYPGTVHIDMDKSSGVLGYRHELGVTYVHTDGSHTIRIILRPDDDRRPKLEYSTRPIEITRAPTAWSVSFSGFSPGKARFTGFRPGAAVRTPGGSYSIGPDGVLELEARPGERLEIPCPARPAAR